MRAFFFLLFLLSAFSCKDIERFRPDKEHPSLPKISSKGYNTAGAFFNDRTWRSHFYHNVPEPGAGSPYYIDAMQFFIHKDSVWMAISGEITENESYMLLFYMNEFDSSFTVRDIPKIKGKRSNLIDAKSLLIAGENNSLRDSIAFADSGKISIHEASFGDESGVVSGTFEAIFFNDSVEYKVELGRFDFKVRGEHITNIDEILERSDWRNYYELTRTSR